MENFFEEMPTTAFTASIVQKKNACRSIPPLDAEEVGEGGGKSFFISYFGSEFGSVLHPELLDTTE